MEQTISYTGVASPWGTLLLAGSEKGICCCEFLGGKELGQVLAYIHKRHRQVQLREGGRALAAAIKVLERYFSGDFSSLDHPLHLKGTLFQLEVWARLREIPPGRVATYGEIAVRLGRPEAARAVGQACGSNPVALFIPCHRVIAAGGKLGGFASGTHVKRALLRHEGWLR